MRSLILIAALFAVCLHAYGKKFPGGIVAGGETREVTFDIDASLLWGVPNFERTQYKVKYYDENGKKQTLLPDDADEIWFEYDGGKVRVISCPMSTFFSSRTFLRLEVDGPLRLYRLYKTETSTSLGNREYVAVSYFIYQKGSETLNDPAVLLRKSDKLDYFSDCPALRDQIVVEISGNTHQVAASRTQPIPNSQFPVPNA